MPPLGAGKHIFLYQSLSRKRKCRGFNIGQLVLHPPQIIYPFVPSAIDLEARKKVGAKAYSIHQLPIGDFSSPSRHMWTVASWIGMAGDVVQHIVMAGQPSPP